MQDIEKTLEAILFSYPEGLSLERLAQGLGLHALEVQSAVEKLAQTYRLSDRGIQITNVAGLYQMASNPNQGEVVSRFVPKKATHLSRAQLETLAIIAYKQPATKGDVEQIRGVDCTNPINKLLAHHLIEETGRLKAPGRPIQFGTTVDFLRQFNLSSISELTRELGSPDVRQ